MTDLSIRHAAIEDLETIVAFNAALALESEGRTLEEATLRAGVRAALQDAGRARYFLACRKHRVVGQLMLTTEWSDWRNGMIWWIQSVYVAPHERRRGVFRRLYEHVRKLAADQRGIVGLRLYVDRNNTIAQHAYHSLGMIDTGYLVLEDVPQGLA